MPIALAAVPAAIGLYQMLFSGKRKANKELKQQVENTPQQPMNKGIGDFYTEAYNRYLTSPENSAMYQSAVRGVNRNTANTLSFLQDRRGALDAVGQIEASQNAGLNNALMNAENQRNQRFGLLGQATNMKYADDMGRFNNNQLMPYQTKLSLLSTKAGNANQRFNAGIQNMSTAANNAAMYYAGKQGNPYGGNNGYQPYGYDPNIVYGSQYGGRQ
jgi:hypothetical protein